MQFDEKDYSLTIEILEDSPACAGLKKGQICKARIDLNYDGRYFVADKDPKYCDADWLIYIDQAKVIKK